MLTLLYGLIVFFATTVGAVSGMGGGIIIKPLLDLFARHTAEQIGFYSCCCVFCMCLVSIWRQRKRGERVSIRIAGFLSVGSLLGGLAGDRLFFAVAGMLERPEHMRKLQAAVLFLLVAAILAFTLGAEKIRRLHITNGAAIVLAGGVLGVVSTFLGIGGGPLNMALLGVLFSFGMKESVRYSIVIIFFSQLSKLAAISLSGAILGYDLAPLVFMLPAAVLGGLLGSQLGARLSEHGVKTVYVGTMFFLLIVCARNFVW